MDFTRPLIQRERTLAHMSSKAPMYIQYVPTDNANLNTDNKQNYIKSPRVISRYIILADTIISTIYSIDVLVDFVLCSIYD
jgi:hypothetical protein